MRFLDRLEARLRDGALSIVHRLREAGHEAYFAGGAVRDLLLDRPVADIDIASSARPEEVERLFARTLAVGRVFGVIAVILDSLQFEVTTFRREGRYLDGRHPSTVTFTDAAEDASRRDFTINALFLDPLEERVIDFVGGREDLERRLIRAVGDPSLRFEEDKLRLMRAVRFACQLGFEIEPATEAAIRAKAEKLQEVSWERIRDELLKILLGPAPDRGLELLFETCLLQVALPEVSAMHGVQQPPEFHPEGDVFRHTRLMFSLAGRLTPTLAMGILLHDVGKPPTFSVRERIRFDGHAERGAEMAVEICRRLRLSSEQTERIVALVRDHLKFIHVHEMRESTLKRFLRSDHFEEHLELHRLDCLSSHGDLTSYEFCRKKLEELGEEQIRPQPLINGDDLIELGLKPGPEFSKILGAVEDRQLEGELTTRQEALRWVREKFLDSTAGTP